MTESEFILENQIKSLLEGQNDDIVKYVREYINLEIKLSKKFILDEDNCYGGPSVFYNENLYKNIKSLNNYAIQGTQTCGYYSMASLLLIIKNKYNIKDIIDLAKKGIFQILSIKILLEELFSNNQNIFKINDNDDYMKDNDLNEIYKLEDYRIGIKVIDLIYIKIDNKLLKFKPQIILDMDHIKKMLISKGFYRTNNL